VDQSALEISGLRFNYPSSFNGSAPGWIIDIPSLTLARTEQLLLTGRSGRGKSTLLHLIAGLLDPAAGAIRVAGRDIHSLRGHQRDLFRGRHIGMIFQTFNLLHGFSALENVMAALMFSEVPRREHRTRAADLLRSLEIADLHKTPEQLSVGQQQRVAVARAVVCEPELVLADEPTASLDPENSEAAMELIQETCRKRGAALLCTSHDPSLAARFTRRDSLEALASPEKAGAA
jgi:ABC-type lipoprotein export system ATPase subunit